MKVGQYRRAGLHSQYFVHAVLYLLASTQRNCKRLEFRPPSISVAGSYWCRKVNSTEKVEVKLVFQSMM